MSHIRPVDPPEFKAEAGHLVHRNDKSLSILAKDLGVANQTLRNWVRKADLDGGVREGLTPGEREAVRQLHCEVWTLRQEREILKKTAAFFARESDVSR